VYAEDVKAALDAVDQVVYDGKDITQFINEFVLFVRNVLILKLDPDHKVELTAENTDIIIDLAKDMDENYLIDLINTLQEAAARINAAYIKKVMLEISIIKLCKPSMQEGDGAIAKRVSDLEKQNENLEGRIAKALEEMPQNAVAAGTGNAGAAVASAAGTGLAGENGEKPAPEELTQLVTKNIEGKYPPAKVHELKLIAVMYKQICRELPKPASIYFSKAVLKETSVEGRLDLVLEDTNENKGPIGYFEKENFIEALEENIADITGRTIKINFKTVPKGYMDNQLNGWDVSKMNIEGLDVEFSK
jgi:DNA polymerase-3 subunit gamma/tau